jgi:hypothetical protein
MPALNVPPHAHNSQTIIGDAVPIPELMQLVDALTAIRDAGGPDDRETIQKAMDWLSFQGGAIRGLESRLAGDLDVIPEKALTGVVMQHCGDEPEAYNAGMALARDVRLLCFFRAIERSRDA